MGKSQSKQPVSRNRVRFALVGSTGCGKSAFVNAVRGIGDEDEDAAPVSLVERKQQPKTYSFPSHPHVSFCELPGYNTTSYSDGETFWKIPELETFDAFLIFVSSSVIQIDLEIIEKVKSVKKPFFLIRTMIDVDCGLKEGESHIKEKAKLSKIKKYLVEKTCHLSCTEENIFLIDNYCPYKWDFFRLIEAIINLMPVPQKDKTSGVIEQYMADVETHVKKNGVSKIKEFLREKLERSKHVEIRFAITGDSEREKSAFINAIRGLECDDNEAGKICHKTTASTKYKHPNNPKISFVDLPCIGTPKYLDYQTFCDTIRLEEYDAFLILTTSSFTQQDLKLAKKVKSMGKSFFLVRTKIDDACLLYEKRRPINEADILQKIKDDCARNMNDLFYNGKEIFLISSYHKDKWDFDRLIEAINEVLPPDQRECFTLSLSNVTRNCLKRKAEFLKAQAFAVAAISVDFLLIPAVGNGIDFIRISNAIKVYCRQLGLNDIAPEDMKLLDKEIRGRIEQYHLTSAREFASSIGTKTLGVEEVFKFIPVVGTAIAGSLSFAVALGYLTSALDELEEAALAVWDNLAKSSTKKSSMTTTIPPIESDTESKGIAVPWQWVERSVMHREMFMKLREKAKNDPESQIKEINGVRVCCSMEFLIGKGSDGTRVYVGLGKDGVEKAVKRLPRDACADLAQQEKKVLNELNTMKSNHVLNYWYLEEQSGKEHLYLILDLCEETLENFVTGSNLTDLVESAPRIIQQVLIGLVDLHRGTNPILHRDLKPKNILRDVENNWLLADFGISRILTAGVTTHVTKSSGTEDWKAVESCSSKRMTDDDKSGNVRYKKESDIQVAGMVAFYILTKGEHPFGEKADRLRNLLDGKPVGLDNMEDNAAKDLISWMLSHDPKDRPSAEEALKHPYLQPAKQQFDMLCKVGNQPEIKRQDVNSDVVAKLNSDRKDWQSEIPPDVLRYLSTDCSKGKTFSYRSSWTDCLRLIRNVKEHWCERPRPRPEAFYIVEKPSEYFLNLFPSLCVDVHKIIRSCDWKKRDDLKEYFI